MAGQEDRFKRKVIKIFEGAAVSRRYGIMDIDQVFSEQSLEARNQLYADAVRELGREALTAALKQAHWSARDLDYIITVSCTGIMIPSVDAYLINDLGLRQDIVRLPVTEMGCVGGVSGMIYAQQFLKANPGKRAAVLAIEAPTATFQLNDFSMVNIVSSAIFGDGAACVLLSSNERDKGPRMLDQAMYHFYDATHMMGFKLVDTGLQMILDKSVPETITEHFPAIVNPFLEQNNLTIAEIDHLIFHPGGRKIVETVEDLFGSLGKSIDDTKTILQEYGNMSSATVLYVLQRFMDKNPKPGSKGLMLSFGPGFTAQRILIEF
jgi:predicted naringenin-chalcone synthase